MRRDEERRGKVRGKERRKSVQVCENLGVQMYVRDLGAVVRMCSDEVRV